MKVRLFSCHIIFCLCCIGWLSNGCRKPYKDYSYERRPVIQDSIPIPDTSTTAALKIPFCAGCFEMDNFIEGRWSFKAGDNFICGVIDTAIVAPDRTALTFFGPSECSNDTGAIFTLFPTVALTKDLINVTCNHSSLQYYDNVGGGDILVSKSAMPMQYLIETYNHSTRIAKGTFTGAAFTKDNMRYAVSGKFTVKL